MSNIKYLFMKKITLYYSTLLLIVSTFSFAQSSPICWKMLSAGGGHVAAVTAQGSLFTWGRNNYGQLGNGSADNPQKIPKLAVNNIQFKYVTTGLYRTFAISVTGQLYGCGQAALNGGLQVKDFQQVGTDGDWDSVYSASGHCIALKENGTMWGYGPQFDRGLAPMQIGIDTDWKTIAIASTFTVALKTNGTMWSWGQNNSDGILGNGTTIDTPAPSQIGTDNDWASISTDSGHVLALKTDGTLWAWGNNLSYQFGNGTKVSSAIPIQIGSDNDWAFINAESRYSIAIKSNGTLWAWGYAGNYGVMANSPKKDNLIPTQIGTATNWKSVSAAFTYVMATKTDGSLWAWGQNLHSNFGNNNNTDSPSPILVGGCSSLGTEKWEDSSVTVYPNPSSGIFHIKSNQVIDNVSITVSDMNGKIVHQLKAENLENILLDLNTFQNGIYILNVKNNTYNYSQKLLKQ